MPSDSSLSPSIPLNKRIKTFESSPERIQQGRTYMLIDESKLTTIVVHVGFNQSIVDNVEMDTVNSEVVSKDEQSKLKSNQISDHDWKVIVLCEIYRLGLLAKMVNHFILICFY
jgi:hypothetical protein